MLGDPASQFISQRPLLASRQNTVHIRCLRGNVLVFSRRLRREKGAHLFLARAMLGEICSSRGDRAFRLPAERGLKRRGLSHGLDRVNSCYQDERSYLRQHVPLIILVIPYLLAARLLQHFTGIGVVRSSLGQTLFRAVSTGIIVVLITVVAFISVYLITRVTFRLLATGRARSTWQDYRQNLSPERIIGLATVWALLTILLDQFVAFKGSIPLLHPFSWDLPLMELDRRIHLGNHPWELIQPLVGRPGLTKALDSIYYLWFLVNGVVFYWMGWRRWDSLRAHFFTAYFLIWIVLGTGLAVWFSSAGPVYYEAVVQEPSPFRPLVDYLNQVGESRPLTALQVQGMLWNEYVGKAGAPVEGISAMPSVHVAIPILLTILAFRFGTWIGVLALAYSFAILLGSVHLGWHYAVDGYVSVILVPIIWVFAGRIVRITGGRGKEVIPEPGSAGKVRAM